MATSSPKLALMALAGTALACSLFGPQLKPTGGPQYDFGDAADPGFPTLYNTESGRLPGRHGAFHQDLTRAWLGLKVSAESDANDAADADGVPNLVNSDGEDDGLVGYAAHDGSSQIDVGVTSGDTSGTLYLNVLADLNNDGQWRDEWLVQNYSVHIQAAQSVVVSLPVNVDAAALQSVWLRITLTSEVIDASEFDNVGGWDGSAPADGFAIGETEDYHGVVDAKATPTPDASYFNVECDKLEEAIVHGEIAFIGLNVVVGPGSPDTFRVIAKSGTMGVNGDPQAAEITVEQNPLPDPADPEGNSPFGPGAGLDITTIEDPPERTIDYEVVVHLEGPGRVEVEKCLFSVAHFSLPFIPDEPGDGFDFGSGQPVEVPSFADIISVEQDRTENVLAFVFTLAGPPPDPKTLGTQRITYKVGLQLPDQEAGYGAGIPAVEGFPPTDPPMRWGYGAAVDCTGRGCTGVLFKSDANGQFQVIDNLEILIEDSRVIVFVPLDKIGNPASFDWAAITVVAGGGSELPTDRAPDSGFRPFPNP